MIVQLVSVLGAITILAAYAANQFGRLQATGLLYTVRERRRRRDPDLRRRSASGSSCS